MMVGSSGADDLPGVAGGGGAFAAKALDGVGPEAEVAADEFAEGAGSAEAGAHAKAEEEAEAAEFGKRGRLGKGGDEGAVLQGEGRETVFEGDGGRDAVEGFAEGRGVETGEVGRGEVDEVDALGLGGGAVGDVLGNEIKVDEGAVQREMLELGAAAGGLELGGVERGEAAEGVEERVGSGRGRAHGGDDADEV